MGLYEVCDCTFDKVANREFDVAFFASGYEERCTYVARRLAREQVQKVFVIGFDELASHRQRRENDELFGDVWKVKPQITKSHDDGTIFDSLRTVNLAGRSELRIAVDYSSMSRLWYAALFNWARFAARGLTVHIDLMYSVGEHLEEVPPMVIRDILAVPGLEGRLNRMGRSVAVFGLGFDGLATLCVLDRLESDVVYAFYASPAAFPDYPKRVLDANRDLVEHYSSGTLQLPLASVEQTYRYILELAVRYKGEANVTLVPMGPKPHVMAAILAGLRMAEMSCLRVSASRDKGERVRATGDVVTTTVRFRELE